MTLRNSTYTHSIAVSFSVSLTLSFLRRPGPQWSGLLSSILAQRCPTMSTESQVRLPRYLPWSTWMHGVGGGVNARGGLLENALTNCWRKVFAPSAAAVGWVSCTFEGVTSYEWRVYDAYKMLAVWSKLSFKLLFLTTCQVRLSRACVSVGVCMLSPSHLYHMRNLFA